MHRAKRMSIDYQALPKRAEALIYAALVRIMVRRLA
jgi:hypothetical protein